MAGYPCCCGGSNPCEGCAPYLDVELRGLGNLAPTCTVCADVNGVYRIPIESVSEITNPDLSVTLTCTYRETYTGGDAAIKCGLSEIEIIYIKVTPLVGNVTLQVDIHVHSDEFIGFPAGGVIYYWSEFYNPTPVVCQPDDLEVDPNFTGNCFSATTAILNA